MWSVLINWRGQGVCTDRKYNIKCLVYNKVQMMIPKHLLDSKLISHPGPAAHRVLVSFAMYASYSTPQQLIQNVNMAYELLSLRLWPTETIVLVMHGRTLNPIGSHPQG